MADKEFSLKEFAKSIKKDYISAGVASDDDGPKEYISTCNLALDLALSGGIAWGYVGEWSGFSQTGKTTFLQYLVADAQKKYNAVAIWLDRENAWDNERAESLGVDLENILLFKPVDIPTVKDAIVLLQNTLSKIPKNQYVFIVIDSLSAFKKEAKVDKSDMGKQAQDFHNLFRDLLIHLSDKVAIHYSVHRTYKIGVMFGDNTTTTGGEGPKFYSTYRIQLEDRKQIVDDKKNKEILGNWIKATVIKTRKGPAYRSVVFPHFYASGIDYLGGYARLLVERNYLKPKNKSEFEKFTQTTVVHQWWDKENKKQFNEFGIENFIQENPEFLFNEYPPFNELVNVDSEDEDE